MLTSGTITNLATNELVALLGKNVPSVPCISARAGISRDILNDPGCAISLFSFTSMLEAAAYETGRTTLGVELGQQFQVSAYGPVSDLVRTARTLGDGLRQLVRFSASVQSGTRMVLEVSDGTARLSYSITDPAIRHRSQDAGLTMAIEHSRLLGILGSGWTPSGLDFEHSASDDLAFYRQHFGCPVRFGRRDNALLFPSRLLDVSLRDTDLTMHAELEANLLTGMRCEARTLELLESVEAWTASSLCRSDRTDVDAIASDFGMSTRSFQRKLASCGASYVEVRNRVRSHIAKCMLTESNTSIVSIALNLGYSETSAFSRGFKTQVGESPIEFRSRSRLPLPATSEGMAAPRRPQRRCIHQHRLNQSKVGSDVMGL